MSADDDASRRVAVVLDGFDKWAGGLDFIRLILNGLLVDPGMQVQLLIPRASLRMRLRSLAGALVRLLQGAAKGRLKWLPSPGFEPEAIAALFADFGTRAAPHFYVNTRQGLVRAIGTSGAQVVLPSMVALGRDFPFPWVGYIFDFQHRQLPEFFRPNERQQRDAAFSKMLTEADVVLANAIAVRNDAESYFPGSARKIVCLPFAPSPKPEWLALDPAAVQRAYGLPSRYFIVCNQFWIHKDHATAVRAFATFRAEHGGDIALVCTGGLHDFRAPGHVDGIRALIESLGLGTRVHLLGHIPKADQIALLRGSIAVLQPTLCEGGPGGGAVYDAVAFGVPALVSDIPVNREISAGNCQFFAPADAPALAALMRDVAAAPATRPDPAELLAQARVRLGQLGDALRIAIDRAQARRP